MARYLIIVAMVTLVACGEGQGPRAAASTPARPAAAASPPAPTPAPLTNEGDVETIFTDATASSGIDFLHHEVATELLPTGGGSVVLDFNDDGFPDLYLSDSQGANALYRNNADGTFTDVARSAGVDNSEGRGNGGCAADYDNDGHQDLYVTNYGYSRLFRNMGDGTFADVTAAANMWETGDAFRSTGCAWGDYDQDGNIDLIVVRHMHEYNSHMLENQDYAPGLGGLALYRNAGDGTFTNVTSLLGDTSAPVDDELDEPNGNVWGAGFQPGWVDFDNDGDLDLYAVNDYGASVHPNVLWRNEGPSTDGSWTFVDASIGSGADVGMYGMSLSIADYDLDGDLDFFMTNIKDNLLLRNNGNGMTFTESSAAAGVGARMIGRKVRISWGSVFFDYDNDGDEDLYMVSGFLRGEGVSGNPEEQPNVLFRNDGDGSFSDVSWMSGADDTGVGRGGVYFDYDGDGCLDVLVTNLGQMARLFRNVCDSGTNWLVVETIGTDSNRDGIGARVTVNAGGSAQIREIAAGGSHMGQNMVPAHFGLGTAAVVDSVTIRWPSGKVQTLTDVASNQRLTVTEPE